MIDFKATSSQRAAIDSRGGAVLVSAGAGSGKTRVLTERLMARITDTEAPADLDSFLIITFTRAAAGELRGRIMEALSAALAADPSNRRLRRQSALLRRAQIGTIHSFCADLLRQYSHLSGVSPDFRILDEQRAAAMQAAALERTLERCYERAETLPGFTALADTVGAGRDDRRLAALVLELYEKMQCHARPEQWAAGQVALLRRGADDAGETVWGREILRRAGETAEYWCGEFDRLLARIYAEKRIAAAYGESFAGTAEALRALRRGLSLGWERARACFPIPFPRLGALRNAPDPVLAELVKARRKACQAAMKKLEESFDAPSDKLLREMAQAEPPMSALLRLVLDFGAEYDRDKQRAGVLDYADLEHRTARLLTEEDGAPSALARELSRRYTEIMVDEYQDVSRVQDAIFRAVSRDGQNLFLVGDVKQSIYRFRLADPSIFTEKYLGWADAERAAPGEARRILLRENFRSRREILEGANAVFSLCMSRALGELDYDEAAALIPGAAYPGEGAVPELLLLRRGTGDDEEESPDKAAAEAAMVARKIRALMDGGLQISDGGILRPLRYGDIALLMRSANAVGGVYRRELERQGIPVSAGQSGGFFASVEVSTLSSMLSLIDNPHQDIPLIAVLRSPALGFAPNALSRIRARDKDVDFYSALLLDAGTQEDSRAFVALLDALRQEAPDLSASELCWRVIEALDLLAVCSAMAEGELRRARLLAMVELSERFEQSGYRGLHRFVLWLRRLAEKGQEPALGAESGAAVRVLSIHKSKGLEFPVVFLCDTAHRFNLKDSTGTVLVHPELGLGPKVTDLRRRVEYPTLARQAIRLRTERETLSEEMRLLYVAMTRARERLYITACLKDPEASLAAAAVTATAPMASEVLAAGHSMADWLISAALADGERHLRIRLEESRAADEAAPARAEVSVPADEAAAAELRRRLAFVYPHREAEGLPSKVTATELKGRLARDEDARSIAPARHSAFPMPDFARQNRPLSGAEKGTATHLLLQYMDFSKTDSLAAVREEIERLRLACFLSDREAAAVDAQAVVTLFASPLGRRMRGADALRREFKFSLLLDAEEIFGSGRGEALLLQGVVDCFFEEAGAITIVDYKTDRLKSAAAAKKRAALYEGQLRAYARALERICEKPVRECLLYFLSVGETVAVKVEK